LGSVAGFVAWPRAKKEAVATPAPVIQSKEEDFDLEKILKYVLKWPIVNCQLYNYTNNSSDLTNEKSL
jgi:hypothetical protein